MVENGMKLLVILAALAALAGFIYPRSHEQTPTGCAALEKRLAQLLQHRASSLPPVAGKPDFQAAARMASEFLRQQLAFLPPEASCAAAYWLTVWKPDLDFPTIATLAIKPPG
jgi:hypothetical protein